MIVVAGIDDSHLAVTVVEHALLEAGYRNADLHVVHVFNAPPMYDAGYGIFPLDIEKLAQAERERVWSAVAGLLEAARVPTERVDLEGYPPDALIAYVQNVGGSLLVVGTRGRGDLAALILGSTSHRAIHLAPCDVLVVKPAHAER